MARLKIPSALIYMEAMGPMQTMTIPVTMFLPLPELLGSLASKSQEGDEFEFQRYWESEICFSKL